MTAVFRKIGMAWKFLLVITLFLVATAALGDSQHKPEMPLPFLPKDPIPSDNASSISTLPSLAWTCSHPMNSPISYDVFLGPAEGSLKKVASDLDSPTLKLTELLKPNTNYVWRVVAHDTSGQTSTHPLWHFSTQSDGQVVQANGENNPESSYLKAQWLGSYERSFYFYELFFEAGLVQTSDGRYTIIYTEPETYSPHNSELLITSPSGNVLRYGDPPPEVDYARGLAKTAMNGDALFFGYTMVPSSQPYRHDFYVFRMNSDGVITRNNQYPAGFRSYCSDVIETEEGMYLVGSGYDHDKDDGESFEAIVIRTDKSGKELWRRKFDDKPQTRSYSCIPDGSGGIYMAGMTASYNRAPEDLLLVRLDKNGNVLWKTNPSVAGRQSLPYAVEHPDGGVALIMRESVDANTRVIPGYRVYDETGALVLYRTYNYSRDSREENPVAMKATPQGTYIMLVNVLDYSDEYFILREITPQGKELWQRRYLDGYNSYGANMVVDKQGNVVVFSAVQEFNSYENAMLALLKINRVPNKDDAL